MSELSGLTNELRPQLDNNKTLLLKRSVVNVSICDSSDNSKGHSSIKKRVLVTFDNLEFRKQNYFKKHLLMKVQQNILHRTMEWLRDATNALEQEDSLLIKD